MSHLIMLFACLAALAACRSALLADDSPFEYREIHLPESGSDEAKRLGLNCLDDEWGIWGHHLSVVLPPGHSHTVYATVDGATCEDQFCFSSDRLYKYIEAYVSQNFRQSDARRFAILPNDNTLVCQCEQCVAKGCTPTNATPAVTAMLERLARRFPKHIFFTSHYLTTAHIPDSPMPANTGVLISAMDFPLTTAVTAAEERFEKLLMQWGKVAAHVYVWDYINNFDDYFTPFPVLAVAQHRLRLYARAGVRGVFLNGSGSDYSSFSRLHTHVIARLMADPAEDWRTLLLERCRALYPVAGDLMAGFIIRQEEEAEKSARPLPLYEGVPAVRDIYLPDTLFTQFHNELLELLPATTESERDELTLLGEALMLPRLELMRISGNIDGWNSFADSLAKVKASGGRIYSEAFWTVDDYISDYRAMARHAGLTADTNLLRGIRLEPLTALDEDYSDISVLTDGLIGLPSNYHCGLLISSADPALRIAIPPVEGLRHISVGLVSNVQFHIGLPTCVTLSADGRELASVRARVQNGVCGRTTVELDIPAGVSGPLVLTIVRNKNIRTMALDEIEGRK